MLIRPRLRPDFSAYGWKDTGAEPFPLAMAVPAVIAYYRRKEETGMDVRVGDTLEMKKAHPCGSHRFAVLRVGMDFRLKCEGCGHEMLVPRLKIERHIRRIERPEPPAEG